MAAACTWENLSVRIYVCFIFHVIFLNSKSNQMFCFVVTVVKPLPVWNLDSSAFVINLEGVATFCRYMCITFLSINHDLQLCLLILNIIVRGPRYGLCCKKLTCF